MKIFSVSLVLIGFVAGIGSGVVIEQHRERSPAMTVISNPEDDPLHHVAPQDAEWLRQQRKEIDARFDEAINQAETAGKRGLGALEGVAGRSGGSTR